MKNSIATYYYCKHDDNQCVHMTKYCHVYQSTLLYMVLFQQLRVIKVVTKFPAVTEWVFVQLKSQLLPYYIA